MLLPASLPRSQSDHPVFQAHHSFLRHSLEQADRPRKATARLGLLTFTSIPSVDTPSLDSPTLPYRHSVTMQSTTRFHTMASRFSPRNLRTSFRRSSSASSRASTSTDRDSFISQASSPASTINSIIFRQKSLMSLEDEEERRELNILEPRPALYFCSLEERMGSL